ncbi:variable surface lipoprotein [Mycoplasmopsis agalactiae]|uniref:variable surface lipoprotein n=1 Tax=Mycoplasmopsis agalactiae TaxID=2110 RepID=UPI001F2EF327|nr:variable surface lipoprotein [Mycoplasmopsis agalactiae]MCE6115557.1 variable surface lipoprotein [Mycoplasmopsis agalactiae]
MKKSKFLLLGSISSIAAIPFVAAKCGDTKEEDNKKPTETPGGTQDNPGGNQNPGTPRNPENPAGASKTDISKKLSADNLKDLAKKLKDEFNESPDYDKIQKELSEHFKEIKKSDFLVQGSSDKLEITIKGDSAKFQGTIILTKQSDRSSGGSSSASDVPRKDEENVKMLKEQTESLVKDLTEKIKKIEKAEFDNVKLDAFKKEGKDLDYVENLEEGTFSTLQKEFTSELKEFLEYFNEVLGEIKKNEIKDEDAKDLLEEYKGITELIKEQFTIFEKVSK